MGNERMSFVGVAGSLAGARRNAARNRIRRVLAVALLAGVMLAGLGSDPSRAGFCRTSGDHQRRWRVAFGGHR